MKYRQNDIDDSIEIGEIDVNCFSITDKNGKFDIQWLPHIAERLNTDEFKHVFLTIDRVRLNALASLSKAEISKDVSSIFAIVVDSLNADLNFPFISKQFQKLGF